MPKLSVHIVRFIDDSLYPVIVACEFADAEGRRHSFIEKVPVVTLEDLDRHSTYPRPGTVECVVLERFENEKGKELVRIRTDESTEGISEFVVSALLVTQTPE